MKFRLTFLFCAAILTIVLSKQVTHYDILGVKRGATTDQIKQAYRKKARILHPDKNKDDPNAQDKFIELSKAHEILSDERSRKDYDYELMDSGHSRQQHNFGHRSQFGNQPQTQTFVFRSPNGEYVFRQFSTSSQSGGYRQDPSFDDFFKAQQQQTGQTWLQYIPFIIRNLPTILFGLIILILLCPMLTTFFTFRFFWNLFFPKKNSPSSSSSSSTSSSASSPSQHTSTPIPSKISPSLRPVPPLLSLTPQLYREILHPNHTPLNTSSSSLSSSLPSTLKVISLSSLGESLLTPITFRRRFRADPVTFLLGPPPTVQPVHPNPTKGEENEERGESEGGKEGVEWDVLVVHRSGKKWVGWRGRRKMEKETEETNKYPIENEKEGDREMIYEIVEQKQEEEEENEKREVEKENEKYLLSWLERVMSGERWKEALPSPPPISFPV